MNDSLVLIKYLDGIYDILEDNSLKVSIPNEINDPFELMIQEPEISSREELWQFINSFNIKGLDKEKVLDQFITKMNKEALFKKMTLNVKNAVDFYFISFSSRRTNPQQEYFMWSLYGSKPGNPHCGVKLHFDSDKLILKKSNFKLEKIIYSKERLKLNNPFQPLSPESLEMFRKLMLIKSDIWSHECEYRLIIYPRSDDIWEKEGKQFIHFPPKCLKKIIFGYHFEKNKIEEIRNVFCSDKRYNHVKLFKTELHPKNFELKYILI